MNKQKGHNHTSLLQKHGNIARAVIAVVLTTSIALSLWYASPTKALDINFPSLPSTGTLGSSYSFTSKISIEDQALVPIQSVDLDTYNTATPTTYRATCTNLPLTSGTKSYIDAQTGGGAVTVTTTTESNWDYHYGYSYTSWQGYKYNFFSPGDYGYGYSGY